MGHDRRTGRDDHRESRHGQHSVSWIRPDQSDDHQRDSASYPEDGCGDNPSDPPAPDPADETRISGENTLDLVERPLLLT